MLNFAFAIAQLDYASRELDYMYGLQVTMLYIEEEATRQEAERKLADLRKLSEYLPVTTNPFMKLNSVRDEEVIDLAREWDFYFDRVAASNGLDAEIIEMEEYFAEEEWNWGPLGDHEMED